MRFISQCKVFGVFLLMTIYSAILSGQSLLREAEWMFKGGQTMKGQVILPERLLKPTNHILIKTPKGYNRLVLQNFSWLAVGQDTIVRYYPENHPQAGYWQMLVGGTYDLYIQKNRKYKKVDNQQDTHDLDSLLIGLAFSLGHYQYAFKLGEEWEKVNLKHPVAQLTSWEEPNCDLPRYTPYWSGRRRLWRIVKAINACAPTGMTYAHHLDGPRWEWTISTTTAIPFQEKSWGVGAQIHLAKPLPFLSKHLALVGNLAWIRNEQQHEIAVTRRFSPNYMVSSADVFNIPDYQLDTRWEEVILRLGARWEIMSSKLTNVLIEGGISWPVLTYHQVDGDITRTNSPDLPMSFSLKDYLPRYLRPYTALGMRWRLRYDWRLGVGGRFEPMQRYGFLPSSGEFVPNVQYFSESSFADDFNWRLEVTLTKLVF